MRKIIYTALLIITLIILTHCKTTYQEKIVIAQSGLNLRQEPDIKSKAISLIPYKETVKIINKDNKNIIIDTIPGNWVKVTWEKKDGWLFDGYLRGHEPYNCSIFHLYNILCYDRNKLDSIIKKNYPKIKTFNELNIEAKLTMFEYLPYFIPGDDLIVITKDKIYDDKIKSLYFNISAFIGNLLQFDTIQSYNKESPLYIKKSDLIKKYNAMPSLINLNKITDNSLIKYYKDTIHNNLISNKIMISLMITEQKEYEDELEKNFTLHAYKLEARGKSSEIHILQYLHNNRENNYYDFITLFINKKIVLMNNSSFESSFTLKNNNYILLKVWTPHTGHGGYILYIIDKDTIQIEAHDFTYSN